MYCAIFPKIMQYRTSYNFKWPLWAPKLPHQNFSDQIPAHVVKKNHAMVLIGSFGQFSMVQMTSKMGKHGHFLNFKKKKQFLPNFDVYLLHQKITK